MTIEQIKTETGAILYDSDRFTQRAKSTVSDSLFDPDYWSARHRIVAKGGGRGGVLFIRDDANHWVLRHFRRGGFIGKLIRDSYLWSGAERTRSFAEWRLLHALRERGLPVPRPVAARYVRHGIWYRADLITEALPAARSLAQSITGARLTDAVWRKIGATIGKFHAAGVHHADLNAHNILLGESASVWILDFDRGRIGARGAWEQSVLARLHRSLLKIQSQGNNVQFNERDWKELMDGYAGVAGRG